MKLTYRTAFIIICHIFKVHSASAQDIKITFVGNCAFRFELDSLILYSDFPYESGAYGYMKYNLKDVYKDEKGIALFTHKHKDHFDSGELKKTYLEKVGPGISSKEAMSLKTRFGLDILPIKTEHKWSASHYSYLLKWKNRSIYFTGDTESYAEIIKQSTFDILFITPWLLKKLVKDGHKLNAKKVVIYHHVPNDKDIERQEVKSYCSCTLIIPKQNASYSL